MKWARIENNIVIEIFKFNPFEFFKDELFLNKCQQIPDDVYQNWIKRNDKWISPEQSGIESEKKYEIKMLKQKLLDTDYQAIKYAEGQISEEEYTPIKEERQNWRNRINELEVEMEAE